MKYYENIKVNPATGEKEYFFPLEITDSSIREYALVHGLEIGMAKLGSRVYEAVMVPCLNCQKKTTNSLEQHKIYRILIQEELDRQAAQKHRKTV